jgi:hypothetical protein
MRENIDDLIPMAKEIQRQAANKERKRPTSTPAAWPRRKRKSGR